MKPKSKAVSHINPVNPCQDPPTENSTHCNIFIVCFGFIPEDKCPSTDSQTCTDLCRLAQTCTDICTLAVLHPCKDPDTHTSLGLIPREMLHRDAYRF